MSRTALCAALLAAATFAQDVGAPAPDVACDAWVNSSEQTPPSLAALKGKLVLLEFWFST